ncbi:hypothetical protein [Aliterella atlantica]|uniref:Peptidase C39-like domain-containing protein n=1 Tax=Aliterella atlantica CENA595 TaxID=1618023 RepID=A0A0D8ZLT1_9CYAN|nr:hypothetical protein [Aliterella atlantica]KJH69773.1 hypothetical protein UH38_21910 [Aliterella atlantica CENA595]
MKLKKATSKYFRILIFLLFFFLNEAVPNAAFAFSSLNACARSRECLALIKESAGTAVSAPTGAGYGVTTLRTATSSGAIKTFVNGVADFAIVAGPTTAYLGWHYWDEAHNGRAQDRAKQRYCAAYPTDVVCGFPGGQNEDIWYTTEITYYQYYYYAPAGTSGVTRDRSNSNDSLANPYPYSNIIRDRWGPYTLRLSALGKIGTAKVLETEGRGYHIRLDSKDTYYARLCGPYGSRCEPVQQMYHVTGAAGSAPHWAEILGVRVIGREDGQPDNSGNSPPLPWKDWPQAKRDAAVSLLNDTDWQRLATSMPVGGTLDPGDSVKAPVIGIPGQEWDNPNTPLDDRQFKSIPEEYPRPTFPDLDHDSDPDETDADDDNDGFLDPYDPQPRNPAVPTASIDSPSSPPDQPSEPPDSEPGEGTTGEGAFSAEETLPYDPPSKVIGQLKPDSCVAASCRMAVYDATGDDIPEAYVREAAGVVKDEGAYLRDATNALAEYDIASRYESSLSPEELKSATENGAAIVSVSTPTTGGRHALIVDGFEGDYALIRDPLPEGQGAAYKVRTEIFMNAWTREAVIIEP